MTDQLDDEDTYDIYEDMTDEEWIEFVEYVWGFATDRDPGDENDAG
jgi:hypothetical protein